MGSFFICVVIMFRELGGFVEGVFLFVSEKGVEILG